MEYRDLEHMKKRRQQAYQSVGNVDAYLNQQLNERFSSLLKQGKITERQLEYFGAKIIYDGNQVQAVKFDHLFNHDQFTGDWTKTFVGKTLRLTNGQRVKFWPTLVDLVATQAKQPGANDYVQAAHKLFTTLEASINNQSKLLKRFIKYENPSLFFDQFVSEDLGKKIVESAGFSLLSVLANGQDPTELAKTRQAWIDKESNLVGAQLPVYSLWTKQVVQHWLSANTTYQDQGDEQISNFEAYFGPIFSKANEYNGRLSTKLMQHNQLHQHPFSAAEIAKLQSAQAESAFVYHLKNRLLKQIDPVSAKAKAILDSYDVKAWAKLIMSNQKWFDAFCQSTFCDPDYLAQLNQSRYLTIRNTVCDQTGIELLVEDPISDDEVAISDLKQMQLKVNNFGIFSDPLYKKWSGWGVKDGQIKSIKILEPQASDHFRQVDRHCRVVQIKLDRKAFKTQADFDQWLTSHRFSVIKNPNAIEPYDLNDFFATQNEQKIGKVFPLVAALKNLDVKQPNAKTYDFNQAFIKIQSEYNHHIINQIKQTLTYINHPNRYQEWTNVGTSIKVDHSQVEPFLQMATTLATIGKKHDDKQTIFNDPHYENTVIKALEVHQFLATKIDFNDPDFNWFKNEQLIDELEIELALMEMIAKANPNHQELQALLKTQQDYFKTYHDYEKYQQNIKAVGYDLDQIVDQHLPARLDQVSDPIRHEQLQKALAQLNAFRSDIGKIPQIDQRPYQIVQLVHHHHLQQLIHQWENLSRDELEDEQFESLLTKYQNEINDREQLWSATKPIRYYQAPIDLWDQTIIDYEQNLDHRQNYQEAVALAKATTDQNQIVQDQHQPVSSDFQRSLIHANAILAIPNENGSIRLKQQQLLAKAYLETIHPTTELLKQVYDNKIDLVNLSSVEIGIAANALFDQISNNFQNPLYLNAKQAYFNPSPNQAQFSSDVEDQDQAYSFQFATNELQWNQGDPSINLGKNYASLYEQMVTFWQTHVDESEVVKIAQHLVLDPKVKAQLNAYQQAKLTQSNYQLDPQLKLAIDQELVRQLLIDPYNPNAMQNIINLIQGGSNIDQWYKRDRAGRYVRINPTTIMVGDQAIEISVKDPLPEHYSRSQHQEFMIRNQKTFERFDHFYQQLQNHQNVGLEKWKAINEKYNNRSLRTIAWARQSSALGLSLVGAALALRSNRNAQFGALLAGPLGIIFLFLAPLAASAISQGFAFAKAKGWQMLKNHKLKDIENKYFLVNKLQKATINDLYPHSQNPHLEIDTLSAAAQQAQQENATNFFPWQGENANHNYSIFQNLATINAARQLKNFSHHQDLEKFNLSLKHQNIDLFAILNQSEHIVSGFKSTLDLAYEEMNQKLLNLAKTNQSWIIKNADGKLEINQKQVGFKALPPDVFRDPAAMQKYHQFLNPDWTNPVERRADISFHEIFKTTICDPQSGKCQDNLNQLIDRLNEFGFGPPDRDPKTIDQWKLLFSDQDQARALFYQNQSWDFHCATIVKDHKEQPVLDKTTTQILKSLSPEALRQYIDKQLLFDHDLEPFIGKTNVWDQNQQFQQFFDHDRYYELALNNYQALINTLKQIGTPQQLINQISKKHQILQQQAHTNETLKTYFDPTDQSPWAGLKTYLKTIPVDQSFIDYYFANYPINDFEVQLNEIEQQLATSQDQRDLIASLNRQKANLLANYDQIRNNYRDQFLEQFQQSDVPQTNDFKNDLLYNHENVVKIDQSDHYQSSVENHTIVDDSKLALYAKLAWTSYDHTNEIQPPALNLEQDLVLKYLDFISNHQPKIAMNKTTWEHFLMNELMYQDVLKHNRQAYRDPEWLNYEIKNRDRKYEKAALKSQQDAAKQLGLDQQKIYSENDYGHQSRWKRFRKNRDWKKHPIGFAFDDQGKVTFSFDQMQTMLVGVMQDQRVRQYANSKVSSSSIYHQHHWQQINQQNFIYQQSQAYQNEQIKRAQTTNAPVNPLGNEINQPQSAIKPKSFER